jgi:two-component system nitrogen regulation response regulator GlnG
MPPLRERQDDVPILIKYILNKVAREQRRQPKAIAAKAVAAMERYHWPGNVRELENVMRRMLVVSQGDVIRLEDLPPEITGQPVGNAASATAPPGATGTDPGITDVVGLARRLFHWARKDPRLKIIAAVERELVIQALKETGGNQVQAARLLGMTRATLRKRIERFKIQQEINLQ